MKEFKFAGIKAGIKKNGKKDLGVIYCEKPAAAAALFTRNRVVAAPVNLGEKSLNRACARPCLSTAAMPIALPEIKALRMHRNVQKCSARH